MRRLMRAVVANVLVVPAVALIGTMSLGGAVATSAEASLGAGVGFSQSNRILWESDSALAADLDAMKTVGAGWVRVDFDWPSIQAISSNSWNWGPTDRVVKAAVARGLEVLAMPAYTPTWARASGTTDKYPPTNPDYFAAFVKAAVSRYRPLGVRHWEIWNEPNVSSFWEPKPDAAAYTRLLIKASAAVRGVDPGAVVISAGLSPASDTADGTQVAPITYLREIYDNGGRTSFDAVGNHPYCFPYEPMYPASWNNNFYTMSDMYALMQQRGDAAKQIWATEVGYPTGTVAGRSVDEATQATRLGQVMSAWLDFSFHGPIFWFSMRDFSADQSDYNAMYGLLRSDFSPKPAYTALADLLAVPTTTVPSAPTGVAAVGHPGTANLRWTAPTLDGGSAITGYVVRPYVAGVAQAARMFASPVTEHLVTGLTTGVAYAFRVAAITVKGIGPASASTAPIIVGGPVLPGAPLIDSVVPGDGRATVKWKAPASSGSATINGYRVTPHLDGVAQNAFTYASALTSHVVAGLSNGRTYRFAVAAHNANGWGPRSVLTRPTTVGAPTAPTAVTSVPGDGRATVNWFAPAAVNGAAINGYRVTPYLNGVAQNAFTYASALTSHVVAGLSNGRTYRFAVAAHNANGWGPRSAQSAPVIPAQ